jgi:hypothetical protein
LLEIKSLAGNKALLEKDVAESLKVSPPPSSSAIVA